ncbi:acyl-CoA dehydrogenase family protein [uncultured Microbacterium sp.]|uniref:acyl-CoA dehydrogenase family protein n=1 Tax=uncultured Microbacterium sp. TaxID=191216 RepID=UPI0035CB6FD3
MPDQLTEEQSELASFVRTLLGQRSDSAANRAAMASEPGYDRDLWRVLCEEIGAASLAIPEEFGGSGFSVFETHLVLEELGAALTPSPYLGSVAIAAQAVLLAGDEDAAARLLPGIADGSRIATLAWADAAGRWAPDRVSVRASAGSAGEGTWRLDGDSILALDGMAADTIVAIALTPDGPRLFEVVDADAVERIFTPALDPALRFATLRFSATPARPIGGADPEVLDRVRDAALIAISAVQVGVAGRALRNTIDYSTQRVQFGRKIGSFQALKHRMADMHVQVETARTVSRAAAALAADGASDLVEPAALAKAWCSDAVEHVAAETIQLHGGIAITWEHDAHLIFKRAHATSQLLGTAAEQRTRIATQIGLVEV